MTNATQEIQNGLNKMSESLRAMFLNEMITKLMTEVEELQRYIDLRDAVGFDDYQINLRIELSKYNYSKKRLAEAKELLKIYYDEECKLGIKKETVEPTEVECQYYIKPVNVEKRPVNGLNVELMAPSARCFLKTPSNWDKEKGIATRWLFSGGSPLVFGLCAGSCSLKDSCKK